MNRIPLAVPNVGEGEARNLQRCIDTTFVSSVGEFVTEFETRVATLSGTEKGVATGAGTLALHMALHCQGIGQGDLVILPSFTFIASANAVMHSGARPWLFDITRDSWTLDPQQVRAALETHSHVVDNVLRHKETGERIAAIMPVYTLGTPGDMEQLGAIGKDYNLPIIADAAAAIGVNYKDNPIGDVATLTCYSFNGNKTITCGGGGMVVGNDAELMARIKHVSTTARTSAAYEHDEVGYNYRMTNLQAAVGVAQLDRLQDFLNTKRRIRYNYDEAFKTISGISSFPFPKDRGSACWFSGFVVEDTHLPTPTEICAQLSKSNIEARVFWKPVHLQAPYADVPKVDQTITEDTWDRIVTLPCSTLLTETEQAFVIEKTLEILQQAAPG